MDKNVYTIEEVDELKAWAEQAEFPAEMQLDKAVYIPDVKETVHRLIMQAGVARHQVDDLLGALRDVEQTELGLRAVSVKSGSSGAKGSSSSRPG
jgi:hypothetical protein